MNTPLSVHAGINSFIVMWSSYIAHGGILQYVLRQRAAQMKQP